MTSRPAAAVWSEYIAPNAGDEWCLQVDALTQNTLCVYPGTTERMMITTSHISLTLSIPPHKYMDGCW